jgi:hypothetical protein
VEGGGVQVVVRTPNAAIDVLPEHECMSRGVRFDVGRLAFGYRRHCGQHRDVRRMSTAHHVLA